MWNIENKEVNQLEFIKQKAIEFLRKTWELKEYKKIIPVEITSNIFAIKSETWNISFYMNSKWEQLFSTLWIYKDLWEEKYNEYLKKLWYKEIKDKNWYYHMIEIKTWKEISQESLQYYEIFEILWNIKSREFWEELYSFKWDFKERLKKDTSIVFLVLPKEERQKYIDKLEQNMVGKIKDMVYFHILKPIELIFSEKHNIISKEQYNQLKDKVYSFEYIKKLIENPVWDYVKWEIKVKKINWKIYKLNTNQITEDELKLYLDLKIINKHDYDLLKDILEKRRLEQEKKEYTEKTRKHISELENEVKNNLW